MGRRTIVSVCALAAALLPQGGCGSPVASLRQGTRTPEARSLVSIVSLAELREAFDAHADRVRVVALLSPTDEPSRAGAEAVRQGVLRAYPDEELSVILVWVDMLPRDGRRTAAAAAETFGDQRVVHFHDPKKHAARAFGRELVPLAVLWDAYLFYEPGLLWDRRSDRPPPPTTWLHHLDRIEPEHYCSRPTLQYELRHVAGELLGRSEN